MAKDQGNENFSVRTDLAVEAKDMYVEESQAEKISGVKTNEYTVGDVSVSEITINEEGERRIKKKRGSYVTIFTEAVKLQDTKRQMESSRVLTTAIIKLLKKNNVSSTSKGLVVGLGNWNVTPDALGPMTVEKVLITNHLFELDYETVADGYRPVAAISPGVMGVTGMETSDIILSIIESFQPGFVIVIDALASRSIERINTTIQLTDTGIHPGSGVGNKRKEVSKETLGVPVIAIGVPTVVDAVTIASDTLDYLLLHMGREWKEKDAAINKLIPNFLPIKHENLSENDLPTEENRKMFLGLVGNLSDDEKRALLHEVLTPHGKNFVVTPKEVDQFMGDMAHLIATGINAALHENVKSDASAFYTR